MEMQPSGRPPVDTFLVLQGFGLVRVASNEDPSLVALETVNGVRLRIGEKALQKLIQTGKQAA